MAGFGIERAARRMLKQAQELDVPELPDEDKPPPHPIEFAAACGFPELDEWQRDVLTSESRKRILNCCRQSGKSTVTAIAALYEAVFNPGALVLMLSPSLRQSGELFRKVKALYTMCEFRDIPPLTQESALRAEFDNGSRVIALPGSEATTRGYSACTLAIVDEASRVPDELIAALRPTLATTDGRLIALSTPAGKRGWFYLEWTSGVGWDRTQITADDCGRIGKGFLEDEQRSLGAHVFEQEYFCVFHDPETAAFSSELIERALTKDVRPLWEKAA